MLARTLKPNDVLKVSAFGTLTFAQTGNRHKPKVAVTIEHDQGGLFLHVNGVVVYVEQPICTFSVWANAWFKIVKGQHGVGFKVFMTEKDGQPFPNGAIRCIIEAPDTVEIQQC